MQEMACVKCQWQGDIYKVLVRDDGTQMCPECHDKVVSVRELRDIRIEEKLDKMIALLVLVAGEKAIDEGDKLFNGNQECDHIGVCDTDGGVCPRCGMELDFPKMPELNKRFYLEGKEYFISEVEEIPESIKIGKIEE